MTAIRSHSTVSAASADQSASLSSRRVAGRRTSTTVAASFSAVLAAAAMLLIPNSASAAPAAAASLTSSDPVLAVAVQDAFNRAVGDGLGSADLGGAYQATSPSYLTVAGGTGTFGAVPAGKITEAWLPSSSVRDVNTQITLSFPSITGKSYFGTELRKQPDGSMYRAKLVSSNGVITVNLVRVAASGAETALGSVNTGITVAAGQQITLQAQATGTDVVTLSARAWLTGAATPAWQATATDSSATRISTAGVVGLWNYISSSTPSFTTNFDDLTVTNLITAQPDKAQGSLDVGTATYPVAAGALFVDPVAGNDAAAGTQAAPLRTAAAAVAKVAAGGTIELRGGTYHEKFTLTKNNVTIQAYPGEAVWFDGSTTVSSWTQSGSRWVTPWTTQFDNSTSYTKGTHDGAAVDGWHFVNPSYLMSAWPDQAFVDGVPLTQVAANPVDGQFAVDYTAKTLTIGSNPAGHQVQATDTDTAFMISGSNDVLQGFGVRHYATSLPQMGTVYLAGVGDALHNIVITDSATEAISLGGNNTVVDHTSIDRSGMTGIHSNHASGSVISNSVITNSDNEHFNAAPAAAGIKLSRSSNVTVVNNLVTGPYSVVGVWLDENVIGFNISNNTLDNQGDNAGIQVELSGQGIVANNTLSGNKMGIYGFDSSNVQIYNNDFGTNSTGSVFLSQDDRRMPGKNTAGASVLPSTANPWTVSNIAINNNNFGNNAGVYGFQVYALDKRTNVPASAMNITINGNQFHTKAAKTDSMVAFGNADNGTLTRYETPATLNSALGKTWTNGQSAAGTTLGSMATNANDNSAVALPTDVAAAIGMPVGTKHIGTF